MFEGIQNQCENLYKIPTHVITETLIVQTGL